MPDYVEFHLLVLSEQPTRPPPGCTAVYWDYFIKGLCLPFHSFVREVLLNLDISLPQINPNAMQSLVAFWAIYRLLNFPDLTEEEL